LIRLKFLWEIPILWEIPMGDPNTGLKCILLWEIPILSSFLLDQLTGYVAGTATKTPCIVVHISDGIKKKFQDTIFFFLKQQCLIYSNLENTMVHFQIFVIFTSLNQFC